MKLIVKTIGSFMYMDLAHNQTIQADKLSLVKSNSFVETLISQSKLTLFANNIPDEATQEDLDKFVADAENEKLAIAAFLSTFGLDDFGNVLETGDSKDENPENENPENENPENENPENENPENENPENENPEDEKQPEQKAVANPPKRPYNKK